MALAESPRIPVSVLRGYLTQAAARVGVPNDQRELLIDSFVEADLRGVGTHGLMRVPAYFRAFARGIVNPAPAVHVVRAVGATTLLDGDNGLGMVVGQIAMDRAVALAQKHGIGAVSVRNSNHSGMLAIHVLRATREGFVGFFTSGSPAIMAPWGGVEPKLGNGPFAWGFPRSDGDPIVIDMAASAAARGKIRAIALSGGSIPEGWALDSDGNPTTDARAAMEGVVLPMAAHKGYAIAVAHEVIGSILAGAALAIDTPREFLKDGARVLDSWRIGHFAMAIDPDAFAGRAVFEAELTRLVRELHGTRPAPWADRVLVPGELERESRATHFRDGIPVGATTLSAFDELSAELGIPRLPR
jgi:LDH2 family malate/lactate/ureidoglycolate dehydrogenase